MGSNIEHKILTLRHAKKSYREIATTLGISKSVVSYWLVNNRESIVIKKLLTMKSAKKNRERMKRFAISIKEKWQRWHDVARIEAGKEFPLFLRNPLFTAGVMLYWGEGDSKPINPLRLSNTDPRMIKVYVDFLRRIFKIPNDKIRLGLILYPDLSEKACRRFWSDATGLKDENFFKTQYIQGRHPTTRLLHGICMVIVGSRRYKTKMLCWIEIFSNQLTIKKR